MSAHMKAHHTDVHHRNIRIQHAGVSYVFPKKVAQKYRVTEESVSVDEAFAPLYKKYTKVGVLLKGIRASEDITQVKMAKLLGVSRSQLSQMENGKRPVDIKMAKHIAKLFDMSYRSFLA